MLRYRLLALVFVILSLPGFCLRAEAGGHPRYFPETGKEAIHQRALDVGNGAEVLLISLQPGYEDFPLIAHLRMGLGARVVSVYFTNGDASPGDDGGTAPVFAAAQRKEEAYAATRFLDVDPFFLNIPDPGVVSSRAVLEGIWNIDTSSARLERVIRHFRPDILILEGDLRGDTVRSMRQILLRDLVLNAARLAGGRSARADTAKPGPWSVSRIYLESPREAGAQQKVYDALHPAWKTSYRSIASEAAREYQSLRLQRQGWVTNADRRYAMIYPRGRAIPRSMLDGLPSVSSRLKPLDSLLRGLSRKGSRKLRAPSLPEVTRAIDSVDACLVRSRRMGAEEDYRLLAVWKNGLEELRCSLLDVNVDCIVSDSLLTQNQLFYLRFQGLSSRVSGGANRIFFPGAMDHSWGVNETAEYQFPLRPPQEFRVLTPGRMDYTFPLSRFGIAQSTLRTRFPYIIIHQDSTRQRAFIYRGEALIQPGPRRTFELLTPIVRATEGAPVVFRLVNISRDVFRQRISIQDSLVVPVSKEVSLSRKDEVLVDTLFLSFRAGLKPGDYPMSLTLASSVMGTCNARSFEAETDPASRVGFITSMDDSPVAQAMSRLRLTWSAIDTSFSSTSQLAAFNVILIDRDALVGVSTLGARSARLREWVENGGRLVVLPQMAYRGGSMPFAPGGMFRMSPFLAPSAPIAADTAKALFRIPNALAPEDWDHWVVARTFGSVAVAPGRPSVVLARSAETNADVIVDMPEGRGRVTLVAIDLVSQLLNLHPGAHRLLANLLAPPR